MTAPHEQAELELAAYWDPKISAYLSAVGVGDPNYAIYETVINQARDCAKSALSGCLGQNARESVAPIISPPDLPPGYLQGDPLPELPTTNPPNLIEDAVTVTEMLTAGFDKVLLLHLSTVADWNEYMAMTTRYGWPSPGPYPAGNL